MALQLVTPPADRPVSLEEAKRSIRVDTSDEDADIERMIDAAIERAEAYTRRQLCTATWLLTLDRFPCDPEIEMPRAPLRAVQSVEYYDPSGALRTLLADEDYFVDTASMPGRIVLPARHRWPATQCRPGAVRITFEAGHGEPTDVPARIRQAILIDVGDLYAKRESEVTGTITSEMPTTVVDMLRNFQVYVREHEG